MESDCHAVSEGRSLRSKVDSPSEGIHVASNGHHHLSLTPSQLATANGSNCKMSDSCAEINTINSHDKTHVSISKHGMFITSSSEYVPSKIIKVDFNSDTYRSLHQLPLPRKASTVCSDTSSDEMNLNSTNGKIEVKSASESDKFAPDTEVYVRVNIMEPNALWFRGKIVKYLKDSDQILVEVNFTIDDNGQVVPSEESERIAVSKANLAFSSHLTRTLPVRSHVIAALTSGIIAEKPRAENGNRYLIFFECGLAGYYDPSDVLEVADGLFDLDNCGTDIPIHYKIFLQDYFTRYPLRIPIVHKVNKTIEFNIGSYEKPVWGTANVIKIDASCITVTIPSTLERDSFSTRVIYKASPKIKRIHNYICYYINKFGKFIPSVRPSVTPPLFGPREESTSRHGKSYTLSIPRRRHVLAPNHVKSDLNSISIRSTNNIPVRGDKFFNMTKPRSGIRNMNSSYRPHKCNSTCIKDKIDLIALRGLNCFSLPMHFGFSRFKSPDGIVIYLSPCGIKLTCLNVVEKYLFTTNCILDIDHFTFDPICIDNDALDSPLRCINYEFDIANGDEMQPISLINFWNDTKLDPGYIYESKRLLDPGMQYCIDEPFLSCCDCKDNCSNPSTCSCIKLTLNDELYARNVSGEGESPSGYAFKRLRQPNKFGIYECNSRCSCNKYCTNRVVQNGIKCVLQVFMTTDKGWGVRTLYDIPKGTFVCTYSAKVMRDESVNELDVYTANLDFIECAEEHKEGYEDSVPEEIRICDYESGYSSSSPNPNGFPLEQIITGTHEASSSSQVAQVDLIAPNATANGATGYSLRRRTGSSFVEIFNATRKKSTKPRSLRDHLQDPEPYVLDAQKVGNIGRFFNHSCEPNLFIQNVFIDTHDLRLPHVAFFTNRIVHAMEELTWDYSYEIGSIPGRQMPCKCRSDLCRGRLL